MFLLHNSVDQAPLLAAALVGACRLDGWQTPLQPRFLEVLFRQLLDCEVDFHTQPGLPVEAVAEALPMRPWPTTTGCMCSVISTPHRWGRWR